MQLSVKSAYKHPSGHWLRSTQNQRDFLQRIAKKLDIREPKEWGKAIYQWFINTVGKITHRQFRKCGGRGLLEYHNSVQQALKHSFPGFMKLQICLR